MNTRKLTYLSYDYIAFKIDSMIESIRSEEFSSLVVIVRGGIFPGIHLSVRTGIPIYYLRYERNSNPVKIEWIGSPPPMGKTLLCEDLAGSGNTLIHCRSFLEEQGYQTKSFVVFTDAFSASTPEYVCFETKNPDETFIVPWEKGKFNPNCLFTSDDPLKDHEYEFTGWDMDGIFLEDVPGEIYARNLEEALLIRDQYAPLSNVPILNENDIIITGRPLMDTVRTQLWMRKHNIHNPIYLRDDGVSDVTPLSVALWKGKKALTMGCSTYVESEMEQAIHIANQYPTLEVVWWNKGTPISIKASSFTMKHNNQLVNSR